MVLPEDRFPCEQCFLYTRCNKLAFLILNIGSEERYSITTYQNLSFKTTLLIVPSSTSCIYF